MKLVKAPKVKAAKKTAPPKKGMRLMPRKPKGVPKMPKIPK